MSSDSIEQNAAETVDLVVGGFGFIGSNLVRRLLSIGKTVAVVDNDSEKLRNLEIKNNREKSKLTIFANDINDKEFIHELREEFYGRHVSLWHLAANSDIRSGAQKPWVDAELTFSTTISLLSLCSTIKVDDFNFASTSAVYGEGVQDLKRFGEEDTCEPISNYGICKLASERLLELFCQLHSIPLRIFRFANVVGVPSTHGVIHDILYKINNGDKSIQILGNGQQTRTFLHVEDLITCMLKLKDRELVGVYNLAPGDAGLTVSELVELITFHLVQPIEIVYEARERGWAGDVRTVLMSNEKLLHELGTLGRDQLSSKSSVHRAIHEMLEASRIPYRCNGELR